MPKLSFLIKWFFFLLPVSSSAALSVGDMVVIGFNGDGAFNIRTFAVMTLASIGAGEQIFFTDKGISGGTFNNNYTSEGTFYVTTASTVDAGTIIMFTINAGGTPRVVSTPSIGTITVTEPSTGWANTSGTAPWTGGDQLLIYQAGPTFIFGFNSGTVGTASGGWSSGTGVQEKFSNIPPGLTNGVNAIGFHGTTELRDNIYYSGSRSGNKATLLAAISNRANWTGNNTTALDLSPTGALLPVQLISFTGSNTATGQRLEWIVANEEKFSHYEIEASANMYSFKSIGRINASSRQKYSFTNVDPAPGQTYYRLKMVDIDNSYVYSPAVLVLGNDYPQVIKIYPNPASSILNISCKILIKDLTFINEAGQRLLHQVVNSYTCSPDISQLPGGAYQILINTETGVLVKRVWKN